MEGHKDEKICGGGTMMVFVYSVKEMGCCRLAVVEDFQAAYFTRSHLYFRTVSLAELEEDKFYGALWDSRWLCKLFHGYNEGDKNQVSDEK